jgi:uncharacterized membrane protein YkoI
MPVFRSFLILLLLGLAGPAFAADPAPHACLNKAEQRAAVADRQAVPLAQAIATLRVANPRAEAVRARLCKADNGLVYVLTLLARNGKVTRATVDAGNGNIIGGR